jgi:hypothetical protein
MIHVGYEEVVLCPPVFQPVAHQHLDVGTKHDRALPTVFEPSHLSDLLAPSVDHERLPVPAKKPVYCAQLPGLLAILL